MKVTLDSELQLPLLQLLLRGGGARVHAGVRGLQRADGQRAIGMLGKPATTHNTSECSSPIDGRLLISKGVKGGDNTP